jgi:hypothetical protein
LGELLGRISDKAYLVVWLYNYIGQRTCFLFVQSEGGREKSGEKREKMRETEEREENAGWRSNEWQ